MNISRIAIQSARRLATSSAARTSNEVHPGYAKMREKYAKFQIPDGVPVHLKGGPADKMLATFTYLLTGAGFCTVCYTLVKMALPHNK